MDNDDEDDVRLFSSITNKKLENEFFAKFRKYSEIRDFMRNKVKQSPKLVSIQQIGQSVEGRPILCLKISMSKGANNKSIIYIDGGMHAREWASITTVLYTTEQLIKEFKNGNNLVRSLVKNFDFLIVPVVNPDGYEWSYTRVR